jgi:hypothetical protein
MQGHDRSWQALAKSFRKLSKWPEELRTGEHKNEGEREPGHGSCRINRAKDKIIVDRHVASGLVGG